MRTNFPMKSGSVKTFHSTTITCILLMIGISGPVAGQGMTRSTGIGVRVNFWNITNRATTINVRTQDMETAVDVSGAGGTLYFFSRVHNNLFMELQFEAVAAVQTLTRINRPDSTKVDVLMPILFGMRYDLLSTRLTSKFQPYISLGGGPYWNQRSQGEVDTQNPGVEQSFESEFLYGIYTGLGTNFLIKDWFALNLDLKYHFVDLETANKFSGLDFGLGVSFMWGTKRELFQLKDIKVIVPDIYPAYYQFYNTYPIALVSVKNIAGFPIEVNVRSNIANYSERPAESGFVDIPPGETADIPIVALLGAKILQAAANKPAVLDIRIESRAGRTVTREYSAPIVIHSRNAWNGDMDKLVYFVTPDNNVLLSMTRSIAEKERSAEKDDITHLIQARAIFNYLKTQGVFYQADPNIPFYQDDRVQYAFETLQIGSGDCDDLVVLFASCLESLGIRTAFVEVRDPKQVLAHLYLLFDTGLAADQAHQISSNPKRFVIRSGPGRHKTVWIPIETTLVDRGFDQAWETGALAYLEEGILRNGLAEGWVRVIDVQ